jgi:hypothetical protein
MLRMTILLAGAAGMLLLALVLAWVATFCRLIPFKPVAGLIKDYGSLIRAHIDLLMMALLCMALYATRVPLPTAACWLVVVGGFTNPSLFLLRAVDPQPRIGPLRKVYRVASFATTTVGFAWVAVSILKAL